MADQTDARREARTIQREAAQRFVGGARDGGDRLPAIVPERIAYHPVVQERFGVDRAQWRALIDAIWPSATSTEGVMLALSYCKSRNLDPFKRPVHIVPVWSSALRRMVETVWPGIGELRTTAHRTQAYAGKSKPDWGPIITSTFTNENGQDMQLAHPEWCEMTIYRLLQGQARPFEGPRVHWLETYATESRNSSWPNAMWRKRVNGQLEKCAEAAALRAAFPEEVGEEYISDEIGPGMRDITPATEATAKAQAGDDVRAGRGGWSRQYETGNNGGSSSNGTSGLAAEEAPASERPTEEPPQQRETEPEREDRRGREPSQEQAAGGSGGEGGEPRRVRRTDVERADALIADIGRASSEKELAQVMRGMTGRIAATPAHRDRIEAAERARLARGFDSPAAATPLITAFGTPMQSWQDVLSVLDGKLKEAEKTGESGPDAMDDPTYNEIQRLLDAAAQHLPDRVDALNRRLDRFSDAGLSPPAESAPEEEEFLYELRDAVESYGKKPARQYLEGLVEMARSIPVDAPGRPQRIGAIRGRNVMALSLLVERHQGDDSLMQIVARVKEALEFPQQG